MEKEIISTTGGNKYLYANGGHEFHYIPSENYFHQDEKERIHFWEKHGILDYKKPKFIPTYSPQILKENLANLRQLLFEVTDGCNLSCKYCGYGELYKNYDKRENKLMTFEDAKAFIDYLYVFWKSPSNISYENKISIGFYGGEPLLNFKLIKEIITYLESLNIPSMSFIYNMTTNAVLLCKHMDYLVEKDFHLLFSLDGNKHNDSYRLTKNGDASFNIVTTNILRLKERYPDFFEKNVSFNTVLHNRNSVEEAVTYIWNTFGKVPTISELTTNGIDENKKEEFWKMFSDKSKSFEEAEHCEPLQDKLPLSPNDLRLNSFMSAFTDNTFRSYISLFSSKDNCEYIPTGTCMPFDRKIFLTVNGKILPCERIGQERPLGFVHNGKVDLSLDKVSDSYKEKYEKLIKRCEKCYQAKNCGLCIYFMKEKNEELICQGFRTKEVVEKLYFSDLLSMIEEHPEAYNKVFSDVTID